MTAFPEQIRLKVCDKSTDEPVGGIIAGIRLFANRKNDYNLFTKNSVGDGSIIVTKQDLLSEISESKNMFIMDFFSSLEDCREFIEITVPDGKFIHERIKSLRDKLYDFPQKISLIRQMESAQNGLYSFHKQLNYVYNMPLQEIEVALEKL